MNPEKPFLVGYATSGRSHCRVCKNSISQGSLRIAQLVQSHKFDGLQTNWHHSICFFTCCWPNSVDEISKFSELRWEDQERIKSKLERKPEAGRENDSKGQSLPHFVVEYAKSSRSKCRSCEEKIEKEEIRMSHKERIPEKPQLGFVDRWHHVGCFLKKRKDLGWDDEKFQVNQMTSFETLEGKHQLQLISLFGKKRKTKNSQKSKSLKVETKSDAKSDRKIKEQNQKFWKIIDHLRDEEVSKFHLVQLLEVNGQSVPAGIEKLRSLVADGMMYGSLKPCEICEGQFVVNEHGYRCNGFISGWTACNNEVVKAARSKWFIPSELKDEYPFMKSYRYKKQERIFVERPAIKPLTNKQFLLIGRLSKIVKEQISLLGGSTTSCAIKAFCCIANTETVKQCSTKVESAKIQDTFIVSTEFLDDCQQINDHSFDLLPLLKKHSLVEWGSLKDEMDASMKRKLFEGEVQKEVKKIKLKVTNGAAVDPETGLEEDTTVVIKNGIQFTATLSMVNVSKGFNSYYKLQLLKANERKRWFVFRAWGRVGTTIGGTKTETYYKVSTAEEQFLYLYEEKTGNKFGCKDFVKYPFKFFPLQLDYGEDEEKRVVLQDAGKKSKLEKALQELIKTIFDISKMKKTMIEFEIDLEKMPLGRLSQKQMRSAYFILTSAEKLLNGTNSGKDFLDCTNKFYTLIPHNFGFGSPPLLNNQQIIKSKTEMLQHLIEIEHAYNILSVKDEGDEDVLDLNYKKLNCGIKALSKDSKEFKMIQKYAAYTHASTHNDYDLEIVEVFQLQREAEERQFKTFQKMTNHKLLWHGSRTTNYVGILSQGLRIAPAEAPSTGYMFGKGIYFADMVSKSANYCAANPSCPYGYALLAEVALGNMLQLTESKFIRKLPRGKHSVKGIGRNIPDPKDHVTMNGYEIPIGKEIKAELSDVESDKCSLLYNEYIVYDQAQVNMKYLVKFQFNYKELW